MIAVIQHNCARSYKWTIAPLEMGLECRADGGRLQEPPRENGGIGNSNSAYEMRKRKRVVMATRRGSGLVVDEPTDISRGANDDVFVTAVRNRGETITRIVNIYDEKDTHSGERLAWKLIWQKVIQQGGTALA